MIISRGRRYVFVHIPKTGGTSMTLALEARAMKDDIILGDTPKGRNRRRRLQGAETRGRLWKHATLADIDGLIRPGELDDLFVFTLVRNPWDRMVSYYEWLKVQTFDHPAVHLAKAYPFDSFLSDEATQTALRAWPARRYVTDAQGREHCNLFIRLEHFHTDARQLEAHVGFALNLPRVNRSDRAAHYEGYYSPSLRQIVDDCCAEDIRRFGYTFAG